MPNHCFQTLRILLSTTNNDQALTRTRRRTTTRTTTTPTTTITLSTRHRAFPLVRDASPSRGVGACHTTASRPSHSQLSRPMSWWQHTFVECGRSRWKNPENLTKHIGKCLKIWENHENQWKSIEKQRKINEKYMKSMKYIIKKNIYIYICIYI